MAPCFLNSLETPLGPMTCITRATGLSLLAFADQPGLVEALEKTSGHPVKQGPHPLAEEVQDQLNTWFGGRRQTFDLPIIPEGTAFQIRIWELLTRIPFGQTLSYSKLAKMAGPAAAVRAVASAIARNPVALVIPCHRVVGKDGALRGYAGGLPRKQWLLEFENPGNAGPLFKEFPPSGLLPLRKANP